MVAQKKLLRAVLFRPQHERRALLLKLLTFSDLLKTYLFILDLLKIYKTAVPTTKVIQKGGKRKEHVVCFSETRNTCTGMLGCAHVNSK